MRRRLFNLAAGLSLIMAIAAAVAVEVSHVRPMPAWRIVKADHGDWELIRYVEPDWPSGMRAPPNAPADTVGRWRAWGVFSGGGRFTIGWQRAEIPVAGALLVDNPSMMMIRDGEPSHRETWYSVSERAAASTVRVAIPGLSYEQHDWPTAPASPSNNPNAAPTLTVQAKATVIRIRYWFLVLLGLVLPAVWLRGTLREYRRRAEGLCPACGYDVRHSPERCPECGRCPG